MPADAADLARLIEALTRHQRDPGERMTLERVRDDLFGPEPWLEGILATRGGRAIGYALFHRTYETAYAARGLYVQDLFVVDDERGGGVGRALVAAVARDAQRRGGSFLCWTSKAWNTAAHEVYRAWGAHGEVVHAHAVFDAAFDALVATSTDTAAGDEALTPASRSPPAEPAPRDP